MTATSAGGHPATAADPCLGSIGIRFDRRRGETRACWLTIQGSPLDSAPVIQATVFEPMSAELLRLLAQVERESTETARRSQLSFELTAIAARLARDLISEAGKAAEQILAIGIHGSGVWDCGGEEQCYQELAQSALLAEQLGKTVIDDFPSRDLAQGGRGGPVESHGIWILLGDRSRVPGQRRRALIDISNQATHITLIEPLTAVRNASPIVVSSDICVGDRLRSELIASSQTQHSTDSPHTTSAAGKVMHALADIWEATSPQDNGWTPDGVTPLPLVYALQNSIYAEAPLEDQLATANYFIAKQISRYVKHRVPATHPIGELLVMGEGSRNPPMMRWLQDLLPVVRLRRIAEVGKDRTILAASIATLTLLHVWQIPIPSTKVGEVPRILGRVTPGSPSNWQRVLHAMNSNAPWLLPLREAV